MTEHGEVRISAAMTLKRFREGLEPLMPSPEARPFTCTGSPLECRLFIVGLNPAPPLKQDLFGRYWSDDSSFLRKVFEADYSQRRKAPVRDKSPLPVGELKLSRKGCRLSLALKRISTLCLRKQHLS